jgi:putative transposase
MGRRRIYQVVRHVSSDELSGWIRRKEKEIRVLKRLYFIKYLYEGEGVEAAADKVGVVKAVGYEWLRRWNEDGYEGLMPKFGGGRPPALTEVQKDDLLVELRKKDNWALADVRKLLRDQFGVTYSENHVRRLLKSFGMKHAKPYAHDYRRPDDAEKVFKKRERGTQGEG